MLQIKGFRETKVYQEALEEGREEGLREVALRLLAKEHSVAEVAELTGLSIQRVRTLKKGAGRRE
jgi:predicted transposase/invertase (TIGR01784 family)